MPPINIISESPALVVVDKPVGFLSVPSRMTFSEQNRDERPVVGLLLEKQLGTRLFPVHRLDVEVSGLLLFAKTAPAHRLLSMAFENNQAQKTYEALSSSNHFVELGRPHIFENKLLRGKKRAYESPLGKTAITRALATQKLSYRDQECVAWKLEPVTGRSHQLRFHLAQAGFPILGDKLYGSKDEGPEGGGIALRAVALNLSELPVTERDALDIPLSFELPALWM